MLPSTQFNNKTFQIQKKILIIHKSLTKKQSKLSHFITKFLNNLQTPYIINKIKNKPFLNLKKNLKINITIKQYSLIIFINIKTYLLLKPNIQQIIKLYYKKFTTKILFFISNHIKSIQKFNIKIIKPQKKQQKINIKLNKNSKLLKTTHKNNSITIPYIQKKQNTK